ncbi:MAG TPA: DNA gyrase subunit A [Candidatus Nanoarchaeia archaeon]|nr:DNA gyrase subunit A [Candidatus Nanoarchaeia archaeon]
MSVIVGRALPDVRDGLKPVHRRVLFGMYEMGLAHNKPFKKSARIVGDVMGKYHPHGDSAIYETMVRLAQDFSLRYPLVNGQGNFGCFTKDTKVKIADGKDLTFGELVEEYKIGKRNFTYTVDTSGKIKITEIKHPRLTKKNAKLVKVTLDNGSEIRCTPDHRFMLLNGEYTEAQSLLSGTSLMPGYFRHSTKDEAPETPDYDLVFQPKTQTWEYAHILADTWNIEKGTYALSEGRVRHHVDFNKHNNNPTNIKRMHLGAHKYFDDNVEQVYFAVAQNHKVVSVEQLSETEDVYDLTVDRTHNFLLAAGVFVHNSVDGDNAAAMRYTEARMNKLAEELLQDIDKETVDFVPNYDGSLKEPSVLPAKVPNLLINGSTGIAVGMATSIPPHNMTEVCDAVIKTIDKPNINFLELISTIKGPDFPTGGIIMGSSGMVEAYKTGHGKVIVRAKTHLEENKNRVRIIVDEIPYMVNKAQLIEAIAELVGEKKVQGISDLRDESDREGMRIVIELKQGANSDVVLNQLFTHSRLQETFSINLLALVDNQPCVLSLPEIIKHFIDYRAMVVRRRTEFDLRAAEDRVHILEGLITALDHIDAIVNLIKNSTSADDAKRGLIDKYKLSEKQAQAILDMTLRRLASLEQTKIRNEHTDLLKIVKELKEILGSETKIRGIIKAELFELKEKYGDARRTQILAGEAVALEDESLIKPEDDVITITHAGYVKRLPVDTYKQQRRGGKGIIAAETNEDDFIENLFVANTHDSMLFFTSKGKVHWIKVHQLPEAGRYAKGSAIVNLLQLGEGEKVTAFIPVKKFEPGKFLFMVTSNGTVKKTSLDEFSNPRKGGIIAVSLDEGDELCSVMLTDGMQDIIIATEKGMAIKFNEKNVRSMGRAATGVIGIKLRKDHVVGAALAESKKTLLTVTEKGYGKRTEMPEYRLTARGGVGIINMKITDKNGKVVSITTVSDEDELMMISQNGTLIRTPAKGISVIGRSTQGVRVMKLDDKDKVISVTKIAPEDA